MSYADKNGKTRQTGRGSSKTRGTASFGDYEFCRIELSAEDRESFSAWAEDSRIDTEAIDYLLAEGCKVSFSVDPNGGGIICSASQPILAHPNGGLILTGRGSTASIALAVLLYKDQVICKELEWARGAHERTLVRPDIG